MNLNLRNIARINSGVILALGLALLAPLTISLIYQDGSWISFALPAAGTILLGWAGLRATRPASRRSQIYIANRDVLFSVTLVWILAALLGGVPYLIEGTFTSPISSSFEAMSGFTTTGSTLLSEIEAETPSILFWRSLTQWLGGIGIVVLFVGVAPVLGFGAARLLSAEISGLGQPRFTPRIVDTAKGLLVVYSALSVAETVALTLSGMNLYDAVVHTFTTVATGGFSPKTASIGFYDSVAIEIVITVFMALSAVSFAIYYLLYIERRPRLLLDRELLTYLGILGGSILFVWMILVAGSQYESWAQSLRYAAFDVTSIMTTTGYITADFDGWATQAKLLLVMLMFVGGCAGSTAGGIKVIRIIIVIRSISDSLLRGSHPQAVTPLRLGDRAITEPVRLAVLGLFAAWVLTFAVATILVTLQPNLGLVSSATAVAATLNVIGPGLGQIGASESYVIVDSFGRVVLMVCMLLGRLEILTALALLSPAFWRR